MKSPLSKLLSLFIFQFALCGWPQGAGCAPQTASPQKTQSVPGERVVLRVGGQKMTAADVEQFIQALPPEYRVFYSGQGRRFLAVYIVRMKVLSAEAVKQKLDQQPDVALALEIARESILTDAARKHIEEGISVSDQDLQELYRKDKSLSEDVRIRHILIRTEDAAFKSGDPAHPGLAEAEARKKSRTSVSESWRALTLPRWLSSTRRTQPPLILAAIWVTLRALVLSARSVPSRKATLCPPLPTRHTLSSPAK